MNQRQIRDLDQLRADQAALHGAARWITQQPHRGHVAALSDPRTARCCAGLLEALAEHRGRLDAPVRRHAVQIARGLIGDPMDRPTVRRTRRRR